RALLAKVPRAVAPASDVEGAVISKAVPVRARVALLSGCAQSVVAPSHHAATRRVLEACGAEVVVFTGCCGALTHHMGLEERGRLAAADLVDRLEAERSARGLDAIVTSASGCGLHVRDYGHVFAGDPVRAPIAARLAALARDAASMVASLGLPPVARPSAERVAYHPPCTLQHGLRADAAPRALLRAAGYDVVEVEESHLCCGSAGTYNLLQPELAEGLRERKLERLRRTGAAIVATDNVGCAMQLDTPEGPRVVHTMELLERALSSTTPET
ncbi:glycolate oxidase iron-sulfur subunit, partial [bacterium]